MKPDFKKWFKENGKNIDSWMLNDVIYEINQFAEDYAKQEKKKAVYETLDLVERYGIEKIKSDVYNADTRPKIQR
jgi:hypothetical protein